MQLLPKWRNVFNLRNAIATPSPPRISFASFHSTPFSFEKRKSKWTSEVKGEQRPSKNYIRYETRQKRADSKKALKDLLYKSGCLRMHQEQTPRVNGARCSDGEEKIHSKVTRTASRRAKRAHYMKRKLRREGFDEDLDDQSERILQSTYGRRSFTYSFNSWEGIPFQTSSSGFEWREESDSKHRRHKEWETSSEAESGDESSDIGLCSDRAMLGLPPKGPLKLQDVKNAFRSSALKWHPDKHQGASQAKAEEKFKLCVNAYKSLCSAF